MFSKIIEDRSKWLLILITITFPFSVRISNILIVVAAANFLVSIIFYDEGKKLRENFIPLLIQVAPFLFIAGSLLYSSSGIKSIEKHLPLLGLPFIMCGADLRKLNPQLLKVFFYTVCVMALICT